jgi:hypothetical protein
VRLLFDSGSLLDPDPNNVTADDFDNSIIEQTVCLGSDILTSLSVLGLLYYQN